MTGYRCLNCKHTFTTFRPYAPRHCPKCQIGSAYFTITHTTEPPIEYPPERRRYCD